MIEAEVTAHLEHPGVVPVHGLVMDEAGEPAYAMRFIKGKTLKEAIREFHGHASRIQPGPASPIESGSGEDDLTGPEVAVSLRRSAAVLSLLHRFVAVCNTIAYAHQKGVIHRDIKPSNIMFGEFGETWVVDWGLAKVLPTSIESDGASENESISMHTTGDFEHPQPAESDSTAPGKPMGTIQFMSPEQATGQWDIVDKSSDIYSLGATLYVILTGKLPFVGGSSSEIKRKICKGDFAIPSSVNKTISPALDAICRKAMSRDQDQRYATAMELARDIEQWLADEPVSCYRDPITTRLTRWARRNRTLATSLVASVIVTLIAVSISTAMLASANTRERTQRQKAEEQSIKTNIAYAKAKDAIDQYLLHVGNSSELKQLDLVDLRRQLLSSATDFYAWLADNSPQQAGFELERAEALLGLAELHWLSENAAPEDYAKRSLELIEFAKRSRPDDFSILRLEVRAFEQLLVERRSELDFDGVEKYLSQAQITFKKLVTSGNPRDQIDLLNFKIVHAEYLDVANRHTECVELIEAAVQSTRPDGLTDDQGKQWNGLLARLYQLLGEEYRQFRRLDQAQIACEKAIELSSARATEQSSDGVAQHRLANCWYLLGQIQSAKGQTVEALQAFEKCEQIQNALADSRPSIPVYRLQLAWALRQQANLTSATNRLSESNTILVRALEIAERLCAESPKNNEHKRL